MSSKIDGAPRELIDRAILAIEHGTLLMSEAVDLADELRALIAAPVVERHQHEWDINEHGTATVCSICGIRSSDVPPELTELQAQLGSLGEDVGHLRSELEDAEQEKDELQATIARLTAENEQLALMLNEETDRVKIAIDLQQKAISGRDKYMAEVERLKSGQGEPVARVRHSPVKKYVSVELMKLGLDDGQLLYTSQPAPVSVVTREQVEIVAESIYWQWSGREGFVPWVKGGNSLKQDAARSIARSTLDKVKELNH